MPEIQLPAWIGLAVTWAQSFLNRWVPESWRPVTLGALATLAAIYVVLTDPVLMIKDFPWVVAAVFALVTAAYTVLKPVEAAKPSALKAAPAEETPGRIGKAVLGVIPAGVLGVVLGSPTVLITLGGALLARLLEKKKPSPDVT